MPQRSHREHLVVLDRTDPASPQWKLLAEIDRRPAILDHHGHYADEWADVLQWVNLTVDAETRLAFVPGALVWQAWGVHR